MIRHARYLLALAPLLITACNDSSGSGGPSGPYPNVQFVHASPDAPAVSVRIDGQLFLDELDYAEGTGEISLPPGSHTLEVDALNPAGPTPVIGPVTVSFAQNTDYVVVAEGPVASIAPVTFPHPLSAVAAANTRVQVLHAAPAAGPVAVYVTAPGASLASSTPLDGGPLAYQAGVGPTDIPAGTYEIRITPANATAPVLFDSGTVTFNGGDDLVITALQNTGPGASPVFLGMVSAGGYSWICWDVATPANVRVVHDVADAPAVSIVADGNTATPLVASLVYEGSTAYLPLTPGAHTLGITAAPATGTSTVLASRSLNLDVGSEQTVYAFGKLATLSEGVTWDNRRRIATEAKLRIIHGAPSAGNVDIYVTAHGAGIATATPTYPNIPFGGDSWFQGFAAGSYDVTVTPTGAKTAAIGPAQVTLANSGVYTAVARDAPNGGAPYGLILLDDFLP